MFNAGSENTPGRTRPYAFDYSMITWWQPNESTDEPWLTALFEGHFLTVSAIRVIWHISDNSCAGFGYAVDVQDRSGEWKTVSDGIGNFNGCFIEYDTFKPIAASAVRVRIKKPVMGAYPGIVSLTAFGGWPPCDGINPLENFM